METLRTLVNLLRDPGLIIAWGGYPALAAIVFLETGAMVFFLPGDSLLVIAGFYAAKGLLNIVALNALLIPMAVAGDALSYQLGKRMGPSLHNGQKRRLLKPEHVAAAQAFYAHHGGKAIVLARFVPVVRTFVPVVAGVSGMPYRRFFAFNVVGGIGWVGITTLIGYTLGSRFPTLLEHIELVMVAVVILSLIPAVVEYVRAKRHGQLTP
jgi:membrane-associated protein